MNPSEIIANAILGNALVGTGRVGSTSGTRKAWVLLDQPLRGQTSIQATLIGDVSPGKVQVYHTNLGWVAIGSQSRITTRKVDEFIRITPKGFPIIAPVDLYSIAVLATKVIENISPKFFRFRTVSASAILGQRFVEVYGTPGTPAAGTNECGSENGFPEYVFESSATYTQDEVSKVTLHVPPPPLAGRPAANVTGYYGVITGFWNIGTDEAPTALNFDLVSGSLRSTNYFTVTTSEWLNSTTDTATFGLGFCSHVFEDYGSVSFTASPEQILSAGERIDEVLDSFTIYGDRETPLTISTAELFDLSQIKEVESTTFRHEIYINATPSTDLVVDIKISRPHNLVEGEDPKPDDCDIIATYRIKLDNTYTLDVFNNGQPVTKNNDAYESQYTHSYKWNPQFADACLQGGFGSLNSYLLPGEDPGTYDRYSFSLPVDPDAPRASIQIVQPEPLTATCDYGQAPKSLRIGNFSPHTNPDGVEDVGGVVYPVEPAEPS